MTIIAQPRRKKWGKKTMIKFSKNKKEKDLAFDQAKILPVKIKEKM